MKQIFFDIECYPNYFLVLFMDMDGRAKTYEIRGDDDSDFDRPAILSLVTHPEIELITFNGTSYDLPMLVYALSGAGTAELKEASDDIIKNNVRPWRFYEEYGCKQIKPNHIDLIEVAVGMVSLKIYGGRLHVDKLQTLPIEPDAVLTDQGMDKIKKYCKNDTKVTRSLYQALEKQIELRRVMSKEYDTDLRSKSDAQIAEAVLKAEYIRLTGKEPAKTQLKNYEFHYKAPSYVKFLTEDLKNALGVICNAEMVVKEDTGHVIMPKEIANMVIPIGSSAYKVGIGGLHSQEKEIAYYSDENIQLSEWDVASYYPNLMLNMGMAPASFGEHFKPVYKKILTDRMEAKHSGDMVKSDSLKIVLNGTFGKTSNKYSQLYSPAMMIQTTLTGQLSLLMLIEMLELYGVPVVSANTDGIVVACPRDKSEDVKQIISAWEKRTTLDMEQTEYAALYSRDVNNYIALKEDNTIKAKGVYGESGLSKNPQNEICTVAVRDYLACGTPYTETIQSCGDITKFLTVRTVNGGAIKDGIQLGKAIRWYYANGVEGEIEYIKNGNAVPRSKGAKPLMDLPEDFPLDIDYGWYVREAESIFMDIGAVPRPVVEKLPRKNSKAWKALFEEGKIAEGHKGKWEWVA